MNINTITLSNKADELITALAKCGCGNSTTIRKHFSPKNISELNKHGLIFRIQYGTTTFISLNHIGKKYAQQRLFIEIVKNSMTNQLRHDNEIFKYYFSNLSQNERKSFLNEKDIKTKMERKGYDFKWTPDAEYTEDNTNKLVAVEAIGNYTKEMLYYKQEYADKYYNKYILLKIIK